MINFYDDSDTVFKHIIKDLNTAFKNEVPTVNYLSSKLLYNNIVNNNIDLPIYYFPQIDYDKGNKFKIEKEDEDRSFYTVFTNDNKFYIFILLHEIKTSNSIQLLYLHEMLYKIFGSVAMKGNFYNSTKKKYGAIFSINNDLDFIKYSLIDLTKSSKSKKVILDFNDL